MNRGGFNNSMSSLNSGKELGGSLSRAQNNVRSMTSMTAMRKQTYKPVSKKRLGTPIKVKQ